MRARTSPLLDPVPFLHEELDDPARGVGSDVDVALAASPLPMPTRWRPGRASRPCRSGRRPACCGRGSRCRPRPRPATTTATDPPMIWAFLDAMLDCPPSAYPSVMTKSHTKGSIQTAHGSVIRCRAAFDSIPIPGLPPEDGVTAQKILIADDSPLVLRMLERIFQEVGIGVVTAKDGLEAIEKAFIEDVQLVVMDVMMPRMNGYQACRLLKTETLDQGPPHRDPHEQGPGGGPVLGPRDGGRLLHHQGRGPAEDRGARPKSMLDGHDGSRSRASTEARTGVDILSRVNDLLDRKLFEATILSEIGRVARSIVRFDESFTSVMGVVGRVVDFTIGAMAFVEDEDLDVFLLLQTPDGAVRHRGRQGAPPRGHRGAARRDPVRQGPGPALRPGRHQARRRRDVLGGFATFPVSTGGRLSRAPGRRRKGDRARRAATSSCCWRRPPTRRTSSWRTAASSSGSVTCRSATASRTSTTTSTPWTSWPTRWGASAGTRAA